MLYGPFRFGYQAFEGELKMIISHLAIIIVIIISHVSFSETFIFVSKKKKRRTFTKFKFVDLRIVQCFFLYNNYNVIP